MQYDAIIPWADWLPGHLAACVGSLLGQRDPPSWCHVGDVGVVPPTEPDLYVSVVSRPRPGLFNRSAALNLAYTGIWAETSSALVLVVDADTVLLDISVAGDLVKALGDTHAAAWAICMDPDGTPHENGSGGCILIRRKAWEKIGGYDEGYEGWGMEEHDFVERLRRAGYTLAEPLPAGRVLTLWHPRKTTPEIAEAVMRNRARYRAKFGKD